MAVVVGIALWVIGSAHGTRTASTRIPAILRGMAVVAEQRAWWAQKLVAYDVDPETFLVHARVAARLVPDVSGTSALAGVPRMPRDWQWPAWREQALKYMARVDLGSVASVLDVDARHGLPAVGTLHLFAHATGDGSGPEDAGAFAAFIADGDTLFPTPRVVHPDLGEYDIEYPERKMSLAAELVLPSFFADELPEFPDNDLDEAYWDLFDEFNDTFFAGAPKHRVCGLPDIVQNPMEPDCAPVADDWRLLAQLDTDEDIGFFWGDTGCMYWWLRRPDFSSGRVERHCGFVQTT
ncbi:YwqG family protein [Solirubrobacter phytolaccae]|uniref:YwqG family protein n=1 Tax=Solirubrobacter phytolaccae TaxID=1404360 RepID=A0A9X3SBW8_9ACTN|nr:DUF1963 domain-containing protein [Solirubrobacter phytolaccae]MDA0183996.1 YwqG family protein [Solirubrobacter phytolaccae]